MTGIQITVNGEAVPAPTGCTLAELLDQLSLDRTRVAVELNLGVVPRAQHATTRLTHGDRLEIVGFRAGG